MAEYGELPFTAAAGGQSQRRNPQPRAALTKSAFFTASFCHRLRMSSCMASGGQDEQAREVAGYWSSSRAGGAMRELWNLSDAAQR